MTDHPTMQGSSRQDDRFTGSSPKTDEHGNFIYHGDPTKDAGLGRKLNGLTSEDVQAMLCPMPRYKSKKLVWALEIDRAERLIDDDIEYLPTPANALIALSIQIHFTDKHFKPKKVDGGVTHRYWPKHGDFFVVYEDGYQSISPRKAFLEGYDRI